MKAKVEAKRFDDITEGAKWVESFLHVENVKVFHILQSEYNMHITYTIVYAEMTTPENLAEQVKAAQENVAKA